MVNRIYDRKIKSRKTVILFILFLALLLRLVYIFVTTPQYTGVDCWEDQGWTIAKNLVEGKGYTSTLDYGPIASARPPAFPLFLAGIFYVFGQNFFIVRTILSVVSIFICLIIYFLGKTIFNQRVGIVAMAITAIYPAFIHWGTYISQETLTTLFLSLSVLFILKLEKNFLVYSFLCGLFLGLSVMTRSTAYGLVPLFSLWIIFSLKHKKQSLMAVFVMLVMVAVVISGWVIRNYKIHHKLLLASTDGGITFYVSNNPLVLTKGKGDFYIPNEPFKDLSGEVKGLTEIESNGYFYKKGIDFIKRYPKDYLRLIYARFIRFWRFYPHITGAAGSYSPLHVLVMFFTDTPIILLGFWGLALLFKTKGKIAFLLVFIFLNFTLISMLIRSNIRYRAPVMPFLIALFSYVLCSKIVVNKKDE